MNQLLQQARDNNDSRLNLPDTFFTREGVKEGANKSLI